jgi:hypothetical protein
MFCDICRFTSLSATLKPAEVAALINEVRGLSAWLIDMLLIRLAVCSHLVACLPALPPHLPA